MYQWRIHPLHIEIKLYSSLPHNIKYSLTAPIPFLYDSPLSYVAMLSRMIAICSTGILIVHSVLSLRTLDFQAVIIESVCSHCGPFNSSIFQRNPVSESQPWYVSWTSCDLDIGWKYWINTQFGHSDLQFGSDFARAIHTGRLSPSAGQTARK